MSEYETIQSEELRDRREQQSAFLADLMIRVLKDMKRPRPWEKVAELAVFEYERNRDKFLDDPSLSDLLIPIDTWVNKNRILGKLGKRRIEAAIIDSGWYLAKPPGEGILLTKERVIIEQDADKDMRSLKSRADRMSHRNVTIHNKTGANVKVSAIQFLPISDVS